MEHLLLRNENECELLRAVAAPGRAQLHFPPGASHCTAAPWPGAPRHPEHSFMAWLRLKLKIMSNTQLRNSLDGVPH